MLTCIQLGLLAACSSASKLRSTAFPAGCLLVAGAINSLPGRIMAILSAWGLFWMFCCVIIVVRPCSSYLCHVRQFLCNCPSRNHACACAWDEWLRQGLPQTLKDWQSTSSVQCAVRSAVPSWGVCCIHAPCHAMQIDGPVCMTIALSSAFEITESPCITGSGSTNSGPLAPVRPLRLG